EMKAADKEAKYENKPQEPRKSKRKAKPKTKGTPEPKEKTSKKSKKTEEKKTEETKTEEKKPEEKKAEKPIAEEEEKEQPAPEEDVEYDELEAELKDILELKSWKLELRKGYIYVVWNSHGNKRSKSFRFLNEDLQKRILSSFGKRPDLSGANKRKKTAEVTMIEIS